MTAVVPTSEELEIRQRLLDELAVKIQLTRRQLDSSYDTLKELGREAFHRGPAYGKAIDDLMTAENALARLARTVGEFGGRVS